MAKDGFYFPHFSNSRHDRKLKRVIKELGVEGYGIYFMVLEVLREQTDFKYPVEDIDLLADEFKTSEAKLKAVVINYNLFEIDVNNMFFSIKFIENMLPYLKMKEQRSLAGKASAEKRKEQLLLNDRSTTVEQSKVNKVNKVNKVKYILSDQPQILGIDYIIPYLQTSEEFRSLYSEDFYNSWISINKYLDDNCKFLRMWERESQITILQFKIMFDKIVDCKYNIDQCKQALSDLDGSKMAKDKYSSIYHGFNTFIRTILKNQYV